MNATTTTTPPTAPAGNDSRPTPSPPSWTPTGTYPCSTVTAAGISARVLVVDAMHSALDQFTAWTTTLGLHPRRHDTPDLDRTYLHARGEIAGTRITITAIIDRTR